jgi:hypothetical protein
MNKHVPVICREAFKQDIPEVLRLYAQPDLDNGKVCSLSEAERHFDPLPIQAHLLQSSRMSPLIPSGKGMAWGNK